MTNNAQSEKEIRACIEEWAKSLSRKDLDAMHKDYAEQYRLYDVQETANGVDEVKALWEKCFPYFETPKIEYKNLVIEASEEMAVAYFNSRVTGMAVSLPPEMENAWLRGTVCFRKIHGSWKCIHEHISFPVNCETNSISFETAGNP